MLKGRRCPKNQSTLEAGLAAAVGDYIAIPTEKALQHLCIGLECLIDHLVDLDGWCDGVEPRWDLAPTNAVEIVLPREICLRGCADWFPNKGGPAVIDPVFCRIRLATNPGEIEYYELKFGDLDRGIGTWPYGKHIRRIDWLEPRAWAFEFTASRDRPTH